MKKFLLKNRIRNAFPVNIKSLLGPTTTISLPVKGGIEVMEYQLTGDVYIKQHNGLLEIKLLEDYNDNQKEKVPVKPATPLVVAPLVPSIQHVEEPVVAKKAKRGRKPKLVEKVS